MRFFVVLACLVAPSVTASAITSRNNRPPHHSPLIPSVHASVAIPVAGTYPRTTLVNGNILAITTTASNGIKTLVISRSTDSGSSWAQIGSVASSGGDLDNGNLLELPNGNVLATFRNHDLLNGTYTYYRITACISTDAGVSWTYLSQVDQRVATVTNNGLWEPFARNSRSGALQGWLSNNICHDLVGLTTSSPFSVYYSAENSATDQDILMRSSTDGGTSWSDAITVAGATTTGRDGMPGCTDFVSHGAVKLLCVFETTQGTASGTFTVKSVLSTNDGASFPVSTRSQVYVPTGTDNNAGAPQVATTNDGTLVVSFMTDENTSEHAWVTGANTKILTSPSVQPQIWGHKTTVFPVQANWPGVMAKTDGTALVCADYGGAKCSTISFS